jgi:hypothetical protein
MFVVKAKSTMNICPRTGRSNKDPTIAVLLITIRIAPSIYIRPTTILKV